MREACVVTVVFLVKSCGKHQTAERIRQNCIKRVLKYRECVSSVTTERQIYLIKNLHPALHSVTAAMLRLALKCTAQVV